MAIPTQFAYRTLKGIGILDAAPVYQPLPGFKRPEAYPRQMSTSWASLLVGTYIITWERPSKDENGDAVKNLKIWRTVDEVAEGAEKEVVGRFVQKSQTGWNLQYTFDEKYCARNVTNEVQFYESGDLRTVWNKLRVEGVADFAISPGNNYSVAVFVPERKGQPSAVKVFNVPQFNAPVSQKTFFKGDKVQLKWNQLGTTLIVLAQTDVDKSNKSYYGETTLYVLSANGGFDSRITLDKEGPIHDVSWSPNSKEFGVIYGYMPAKTTIFNQRAVATHTFQLAGFGNLAGQMDIYDLEKDYKKICTIEGGNPSVCEWSPDSKYILTATTSPRLRVDNGVRLWHVTGGIMYNEDMVELYHVTWRPQRPESFPAGDFLNPVPQPHPSAVAYLGTVKTPSKPAGAYRPPGARAKLHHPTSNVKMKVALLISQVPGADLSENSVPGATVPGAEDENLSKAALKNKKKREAKKLKDAEAKASGLGAGTPDAPRGPGGDRSPDRRDRQRSRSKSNNNIRSPSQHRTHGNGGPHNLHQHPHPHQNQTSKWRCFPNGGSAAHGGIKNLSINSNQKSNTPSHQFSTPELSVTSPGGDGSPSAKKKRGLQKKIRAIEDLEMRRAGGEKLEDTQVKKIATKSAVQAELDALDRE
ncbi:hypothetical protein EYC84_009019 [Monilinia fructicola]|uniref:Eukaryotic translation initiation factor 2A n=1 Tax=Monilinia fructicola TaxID=38448 RepID=A0A5M9JFH3_MONFR|nr:hypothetical protein EYC84_009019 [Monilinia fructicola]